MDSAMQRAAAYVRMSTTQQQYSVENQLDVITAYANTERLSIVRIYKDFGRSGLSLRKRTGLRNLIADVLEGRADFSVILVYDVGRWGRFQNIDESAHYEFICRRAGMRIEYCADGFRNDTSMLATLIKCVKRTVAAEYSRELSVKADAGHRRLIRLGFHQGGTPGFGLRRVLVDHHRRRKKMLSNGEQKSIREDRVILEPGPEREVQVVRKIFRLYVENGYSHRQLAQYLNRRGIRNERGNPWSNLSIGILLRNERYIGNLIYNRTSLKLQSTRIINDESEWVRCRHAIKPIIDPKLFAAAQQRLRQSWAISDVDLLNHLTAVWCVTGYLSCKNLQLVANSPTVNTYRDRFGSVENAFHLLAYQQTHPYRYSKIGSFLRKVEREIICKLTALSKSLAPNIRYESEKRALHIGEIATVSTAILPYLDRSYRHPGWWLRFRYVPKADLILAVRLTRNNGGILDYFLLPFPLSLDPPFCFASEGPSAMDRYRLGSLSDFCTAVAHSTGDVRVAR